MFVSVDIAHSSSIASVSPLVTQNTRMFPFIAVFISDSYDNPAMLSLLRLCCPQQSIPTLRKFQSLYFEGDIELTKVIRLESLLFSNSHTLFS